MARKRDPPSEQIQAAAQRLYELAKARGWNIQEFARHTGRPFQSLINWKKGHRSAYIENLEVWARPLGATVTLTVSSPSDPAEGKMHVTWPETVVIAQMIDALPQEDRELWRKQIAEFAAWRRANPTRPAAEEITPRDRSRTATTRR